MNDEAPDQHVVVAGLLRQHGRALMVHRARHRQWYPDTWDLPGGHVTEGEEHRVALTRELHEELGILVDVVGDPFAQLRGTDFRIDIWVVDHWRGVPRNACPDEHDALAWLTAGELHGLRLADPRLPRLLHAALKPSSRATRSSSTSALSRGFLDGPLIRRQRRARRLLDGHTGLDTEEGT